MAQVEGQIVWVLINLLTMNRSSVLWLLSVLAICSSCSQQNQLGTSFLRLDSPPGSMLNTYYIPTPDTDIPSLYYTRNDTTTIINFSDNKYNHITDIQWIIEIDTFTYQTIWNLTERYGGHPLGDSEQFNSKSSATRYLINGYYNIVCSCAPLETGKVWIKCNKPRM